MGSTERLKCSSLNDTVSFGSSSKRTFLRGATGLLAVVAGCEMRVDLNGIAVADDAGSNVSSRNVTVSMANGASMSWVGCLACILVARE